MRELKRVEFIVIAIILSVVVCWYPVSRFILGFDYNGRTPLFLMILLLLIFGNRFRFVFKKPLVYFMILNIYIIINSFIKGLSGFQQGPFIFISVMVSPIIFMWIIVVMSKQDYDKTLKTLYIMFISYTLLTLFDSSIDDRFGIVINANTLAMNVLFSIVFASLLFLRKRITLIAYFLFIIIPTIIELRTASRTGVIAMAIVFLSVYLLSVKFSFRNMIVLLVVGVIMYFSVSYILEHSLIGERLLHTQEQSDAFVSQYGGGIWFLDRLGDRGPQYYLSWPLFLENFWTGIGFGNWINYNSLSLVAHSQYMVLYVENGIIAFIIYMAAIFWYFSSLTKTAKKYKRSFAVPVFFLVIIVDMLLMNFVMWSYDMYGYYAVFALGYVIVENKEKLLIK